MDTTQWSGEKSFTDSASMKEIKQAMDNPENKIITLYKPGAIVKTKDGQFYLIDKNGARRKLPTEEIKGILELHFKPKK